jgi:hypothetical protein
MGWKKKHLKINKDWNRKVREHRLYVKRHYKETVMYGIDKFLEDCGY